ncbi:hypothetical protein RHSIM_Rhsim05G0204900 [Rhododendron simsii]|uniref:Uncharacterized protein n=1 Tax=Rhododendron simsii TaxID=118357 RepID=A0A834H263_RHOSS|nr:hypothetical protein RHSIM_Rhsim05G0204900 [Rhododendron simsii]
MNRDLNRILLLVGEEENIGDFLFIHSRRTSFGLHLGGKMLIDISFLIYLHETCFWVLSEFNNLDMATQFYEQVNHKMATLTISDDSMEQDDDNLEEDVLDSVSKLHKTHYYISIMQEVEKMSTMQFHICQLWCWRSYPRKFFAKGGLQLRDGFSSHGKVHAFVGSITEYFVLDLCVVFGSEVASKLIVGTAGGLSALANMILASWMEPCCDGKLVFDAGRVAALLVLGISAPLSNEKHTFSIPPRIFYYAVELLAREDFSCFK